MKPMLAAKMPDEITVEEYVKQLSYPLWASPKLDGIRCLLPQKGGSVRAVTRRFKPVPNNYIRKWLENPLFGQFDGEIVTYDEGGGMKDFNDVQSDVMSEEGEPNFKLHVFDILGQPDVPFVLRRKKIFNQWVFTSKNPLIEVVDQWEMKDAKALLRYEERILNEGFEGLILRSPDGGYKFGRSTVREGIMLKLTRRVRDEAVVVDFEERLQNNNPAKRNVLGRLERSSHKANLVGRGDLGALIVKSKKFKEEFSIGTGFDDKLRKWVWENKKKVKGSTITYEYKDYGTKDRPRQPVFIGFRKD